MAAKEMKEKRRGLRWRSARGETVRFKASFLLRWADTLVHFFLGAVLAGAEIFGGYAPFGVALVGASGSGLWGAAALAGAFLGYMTQLGFSLGLRYSSAAILTFAVGFAFYDVKLLDKPWAMPLVAGGVNACAGFLYLSQGGWLPQDVIYFLAEIALTVSACRCYRQLLRPMGESGETPLSWRSRGCLAVLCATLVMSLAQVKLYRELSLGRGAGASVVLAVAWQGGPGAGAAMGVCLGLAMDLAAQGPPVYAMALGLAGVAAGFLRGKGRLWAALTFVAANGAAVLWTWGRGITLWGLYEGGLGALAFLLLPLHLVERLGSWLTPQPIPDLGLSQRRRAEQKLSQSAKAFRQLYETMRVSFRPPRNDNDVAVIFDRAASRVCRGCALRQQCWERDYAATFNALNDATAAMMERGKGEPGDFPPYFASRCVRFSQFLQAVNQEITGLLYRRQYNSRIQDSRWAVCRQYAQLSNLLESAAAELSQELIPDPAGERRLSQKLSLLDGQLQGMVFRDNRGLLRAEIRGLGAESLARPDDLLALSQSLGAPMRVEEQGEDYLALVQQEPLMAVAGVAARKKDGETVSGDAGTYFKREDGTLYVLLCDGMGSGPQANRESTLALRLLEQFLQAGVETEHALVTLSSALALRGEEAGGFTTVDLLQIDLFTGEGALYKLGAAPTYIRKGDTVRRVGGSSLPAGLPAGEFSTPDRIPVHLSPGDYVLMVSDGITGTEDDRWLRERLAAFQGESPKELAGELVTHSPQGATDDRTAMVVRISPRTLS